MAQRTKAFWITVSPINPGTGAVVNFNFTTSNNPGSVYIVPGSVFYPYLQSYPDTEISCFSGEFNGEAYTSISSLELDAENDVVKQFPGYVWDGASVSVYKGYSDETNFANLSLIFTGSTESVPEISESVCELSVKDKLYLLDKEVFTDVYLGNGGIEGPAELEGRYKPYTFGRPLNVEPILINSQYLVYQYHGYGTAGGVLGLYENGLQFPAATSTVAWQGSAAATYSALIAVSLSVGQWATAPSIGCFRLGGEPKSGGVITCDPEGAVTSGLIINISDVLNQVVSRAGQSSLVDVTTFSGLFASTHNQTISDYITSSQNALSMVQSYMQSVGGYMFTSSSGKLRFGLVRFSSPLATITTDNSVLPIIGDSSVQPTSAPFKKLRLGGDKNFRVQNLSEISDALYQSVAAVQNELDDLANEYYQAASDDVLTIDEKIRIVIPDDARIAEAYTQVRARAVALAVSVTALDNARTAYLNSRNSITPAWNDTGSSSTINPTFRSLMTSYVNEIKRAEKKVSEEDAKKADWTGIASTPAMLTDTNTVGGVQTIKPYYVFDTTGTKRLNDYFPSEIGADKTGNNMAASLFGQGAFATLNSAGYGTSLLTGFGALSPLNSLFFGSSLLTETNGGVAASLNNFKTALGVAASIFAQGWGATASQSRADNYNVPLGANSIYNSRFQRGTYGWTSQPASNGSTTYPVSVLVNNTGYFGMRDVFRARVETGGANWVQNGTTMYADVLYPRGTWRGGPLSDLLKFGMPVKLGDRIAVTAQIARHRCTVTLYALMFDANGTFLTAPNWSGGRLNGGQNGDLDNFDRIGGLVDITMDAAWCIPMVRMFASGEADPYVFVTEVMTAKVPVGQTALPDYTDGPDDPLADQTSQNTSAAFTGQGAFATLNSAAYGSALLTGFGALSPLNSLFFGSSQLTETNGGVAASLNNFKTSLGTANAFNGQGVLATRNRVQLQSGEGGLTNQANNQWLLDGHIITSSGTAASFSGQTAWATLGVSTNRVSKINEDGNIPATGIYKAGVNWLDQVWPQELGANVTESRTANAFNGQGALATVSSISYSNVAAYFNFNAFRLDYSITRSDGVSIVTENLAITSLGVASGFYGQGVGATSNSLADLDPVQNTKLNGLVSGGRRAFSYEETARVMVQPSSSVYFEASCLVNAGGNNGTIQCLIQISPNGANSWSTVATGPTDTVGPTEAGSSQVTGSYTNSGGSAKVYDVRVEVLRTGSTAGGTVDRTETYLLA